MDYQNIGTHTAYPFFVSYPLGYFKTLPKGENINGIILHRSSEDSYKKREFMDTSGYFNR